jgi:hypothetical protein
MLRCLNPGEDLSSYLLNHDLELLLLTVNGLCHQVLANILVGCTKTPLPPALAQMYPKTMGLHPERKED